MPAELWSEAVSLACGEYSVHQITRWLKVDYGALKRRVTEAMKSEGRKAEPEVQDDLAVARYAPLRGGDTFDSEASAEADALRFIELNGESLFGRGPANERVVELVGTDGERMTIRQPMEAELDVVGLAEVFWRCGS